MAMSRAELYMRAQSGNWADYQLLIRELNDRFTAQVHGLARAWVGQTRELTGKYPASEGWELFEAKPKPYVKDPKEYTIEVKLRRQTDRFTVRRGSDSWDPDGGLGWGYGSNVPEHDREYEFEYATLYVPNEFIEKAVFKNDVLQP